MHVVTNMTFDCNLRCRYCYLQTGYFEENKNRFNRPPTSKITKNDWLDGLMWLEKEIEPISVIDISGGEPFLFDKLTDYINEIPLRIFVGLTTNGRLISKRFFDTSDERKKRMSVILSLHLENGKIPANFNFIIRDLKKHGFRILVNFVSFKDQENMIEQVIELCNSEGVRYHIEPHIDYNRKNFRLSDLSDLVLKNLDIETRNSLDAVTRRKIPSKCNIGTSYLFITPDGSMFQCLGFFLAGKPPIGNIFKREIYKLPDRPQECDIFCACAQNWA